MAQLLHHIDVAGILQAGSTVKMGMHNTAQASLFLPIWSPV
jgi:hypothetical protein